MSFGSISYSVDNDWKSSPVKYGNSDQWDLLETVVSNRGLVAYVSGQDVIYIDTLNYWVSLVSKTAALRICQVIGNKNVTVGYESSAEPYTGKLSKAASNNTMAYTPTSVCIGTKRLFVTLQRATKTLTFEQCHALTKLRVRSIPDYVYSVCYLPVGRIQIPDRYTYPGKGTVLSFLQPLFADTRSMITYLWTIGNCVIDPIAKPRCLMMCGPGGAGKSTCIRMAMFALFGACTVIGDNILTKDTDPAFATVCSAAVKSRLITCFELDLNNKLINMSMFKNVTGGDYMRVGENMAKSLCSLMIATNGLPNIERQPEMLSDALSRRVVSILMNVSTAGVVAEIDPSDAIDSIDVLCASIYIRELYPEIPLSPLDFLLTLTHNKYHAALKYIREEKSRLITAIEGREVIAIISALTDTSISDTVSRCRYISTFCLIDTTIGWIIRGLVPI